MRANSRSGWTLPLRAHLLLLVVGTLLPALALATVLIRRVVDDNRLSVERRLLETARAEAGVVDAELSGTIRALQALAESARLSDGDLPTFRDEARRLQQTQAAWEYLVVHGPDGAPILDTLRPYGEPPFATGDSESLANLIRTTKPTVGTLTRGPDGSLAFPVRVPVVRDGRLLYVLSAVMTPARFAASLPRQKTISDEWVRGIVDSSGVIVARTRDAERFIGEKGTPEFLKRFTNADEAVYPDVTLDGQSVYGSFARAPVSRWIAGVAVPAQLVDAGFQQSMFALAGVGLLLLGLGSGAAFISARRISQDIAGAASAADDIVNGKAPDLPRSNVVEVLQLSHALERSAALLREQQHEREEHVVKTDAARRESEIARGAAEAARIEAEVARRFAEGARIEAEAARLEAEAADRAKDAFLAMLGHELRNPLAPVLTALELMRLRGDSPSQRERAIIERQVRHLVRLVDDLLDVSRLRRGRVELRRQPFELVKAIEKAVEIAMPFIQDRGHRLTVDVAPKGLVIDGDETRIAQVFANLLTNAAKYADHPGQISIRAAIESGRVVVTCRDDGMGMGPQLLPRVFDLFAQGNRMLDRPEGGLGLGLAVAKTLVELHGGSIEAASEGVGRGSTFTIRLPLASVAADEPIHMPALDGADRDGRRVLVVDDNRDAAEMVAETLRLNGHHVEVEFDGAAALETMRRFNPDVAIVDIGLPAMDGFQLARRMRELNPARDLRIIAVTGYGQHADIAQSRAAGIDIHLVKPVTANVLFEAVRA